MRDDDGCFSVAYLAAEHGSGSASSRLIEEMSECCSLSLVPP